MSGQASHERRKARRSAERAEQRRDASASTRDLMRPGVPTKRKRATQSGQRAGDGSGRLSDWTRPATLPFSIMATAGDRRWDMTANGSHR